MEFFSEKALKLLPFAPEPKSQWNNNTDLLKFLEELYDQDGTITTEGKKINVNHRDYGKYFYEYEQELLPFLEKQISFIAQKNPPAIGAVTQIISIPEFSNEPIFGKFAKYLIAWDACVKAIMSKSAFYSLGHLKESQDEIKCSILLASNLYYKQALQVLRSFLEEVVLPIHFCNNPKEFRDWKLGKYQAPTLRGQKVIINKKSGLVTGGLLKHLVEQKNISQEIANEVDYLYGQLNGCIHGNQIRLIHRGVHTGTWDGRIFKEKDFCDWCEFICRVINVGIHLLSINTKQWLNIKQQEQILCSNCHSQKLNMIAINIEGQKYTEYECSECQNEMTFNSSNKQVYKVRCPDGKIYMCE
ncbi:MAG: hypothetical protein ACYTX0_36245 [Nostoc sp.]